MIEPLSKNLFLFINTHTLLFFQSNLSLTKHHLKHIANLWCELTLRHMREEGENKPSTRPSHRGRRVKWASPLIAFCILHTVMGMRYIKQPVYPWQSHHGRPLDLIMITLSQCMSTFFTNFNTSLFLSV